MSNHLAVASVTAALRTFLDDAIQASDVIGADVKHLRPDLVKEGDKCINVYLYRVSPNPQWRNADLPTRQDDGTPVQRAVAGMDLHYLFSFHGADSDYEPERLLGATVQLLHARPVLARDTIRAATGADQNLHDSDLADQAERVRLTLTNLSLEDLSKLWSIFFQTKNVLSVAYTASVVLIEEAAPTPAPALPVTRPARERVFALAAPIIDSVEPGLVDPGGIIRIRGRALLAEGHVVRLTTGDATPDTAQSTDSTLVVTLPTGLRAGPSPVIIVNEAELGANHIGLSSNTAYFILRPKLSGLAFVPVPDRAVTAVVDPPVGPDQVVELLLFPTGGAPRASVTLPADRRTVVTANITFGAAEVAAGAYLARVRVAGADSALEQPAGGGPFTGPVVTVPP